MIKLRRNGCSCPCFVEVEKIEVGLNLGDSAVISKVKPLKNGKTRVEIRQYIESSNPFKNDELVTVSYQTI